MRPTEHSYVTVHARYSHKYADINTSVCTSTSTHKNSSLVNVRARFRMEVSSLYGFMSSISEELYIVLCWYAFSVNAWVDTVCMDILSWWMDESLTLLQR